MRPKADPVKPGQLSVWDFPRPAVAEPCDAQIRPIICQHGDANRDVACRLSIHWTLPVLNAR